MADRPDFDLRTLDLAQYFAPFGRRPMPERAIWLLSLASSVMPENSVGCEVWLSRVAGVYVHDSKLRAWARGLADAFGSGEVKPRMGQRKRAMFAAYSPAWGHVAADDGLMLTVDGRRPPTEARCRSLDVHHDKFDRMANLIAAFSLMQAAQYEDALRWAVRSCRVGEIDLDDVAASLTPRPSAQTC